MGDSTSNSGLGACSATKSGKRKTGVEDAVSWVAKYPGIDGFTAAWLHAGGSLVKDGSRYHLSGSTVQMKLGQFSEVLKMQGRAFEAADRDLIEESPRLVIREVRGLDAKNNPYVRVIKSKGYKLMGAPDPVVVSVVIPVEDAAESTVGGVSAPVDFDIASLADSL